jgi:N-hydroxyarylamine O-acetyltransferase
MGSFDLDAYLTRIDARSRRFLDRPHLDTIGALMAAHMAAIPFENLDVLLGRGIRVDLESVFAKLVTDRRGGYCYEHGTLFQAALRAMGDEVTAHSARVLLLAPKSEAPRTHMFLTVVNDGTTWVLDPGFGGPGPLVPVPLVDGQEARHGRDVHRLVQRDGEWVLEALLNGAMAPLWTASLEPQFPVDFALANHYVATFPESPFVTRLMIRALTPDGRVSAMNRDLTLLRNGVAEKQQIADRAALRQLISTYFGFDMPEIERLRIPSVPEWA